MCLALPAQVVTLWGVGMGTVDLGGVRKKISMALVPEVRIGDYVIVHVGYAIGVLDTEEAEATLKLFGELAP
jgi:hydrogenase expression/formation protein HypC